MGKRYCEVLLRNWFTVRGSFDGVEETKLYEQAKKHAMSEGVPIRDYIYEVIGIKGDSNYSAEDMYKIRVNYYRGNNGTVTSMIRRRGGKGSEDLESVMSEDFNIINKEGVVDSNYLDLVLIVSEWMSTSEKLVYPIAGKEQPIGVLFNSRFNDNRYRVRVANVEGFVSKEGNINYIKSKLGEVQSGKINAMYNDKLYVKEKYDENKFNNVIKDSLRLCFGVSPFIDVEYLTKVVSAVELGGGINTVEIFDEKLYVKMVEISMRLGRTISQIIKEMYRGFVSIMDLNKMNELGFIALQHLQEGTFMIFTPKSNTKDEFFVISEGHLARLYNNDYIKSIVYKEGDIVLKGKEIKVGNKPVIRELNLGVADYLFGEHEYIYKNNYILENTCIRK